jgi:hypothetical protein
MTDKPDITDAIPSVVRAALGYPKQGPVRPCGKPDPAHPGLTCLRPAGHETCSYAPHTSLCGEWPAIAMTVLRGPLPVMTSVGPKNIGDVHQVVTYVTPEEGATWVRLVKLTKYSMPEGVVSTPLHGAAKLTDLTRTETTR